MSGLIPPLTISPVLREAVGLKSEELDRAKAAFKGRYDQPVDAPSYDVLKRLGGLLERIKTLDPYLERDDDVSTLRRYVEQAKNDRSVSRAKLERLEKEVIEKLEKHANRLEVSSLHIDLLKEVMDSQNASASLATKVERTSLDDEFEMVEGELEAAFDKFQENTFEPVDVDTRRLEQYLSDLFKEPGADERLGDLRQSMQDFGEEVMTGSEEVDEELVTWCIMDLIRNGLVSDEKKKTLQGYLQSPLVIRELKSTLNMKSVRHWNWRNADKGLPVTARQNAEGGHCIVVEEDIIDMLFLHTLAVSWSMKLRESLRDMISYKGIWPGNKLLTIEELEKREYYLLPPRIRPTPRSCATCHGPPLPPLEVVPPPPRRGCPPPPPPPPPVTIKQKKKSGKMPYPIPPPAPMPVPVLNDERYRNYIRDLFVPRLPKLDGCYPKLVPKEETQAILLKTLVTEAKLRKALDGSVHGISANFSSFASSLPHQTILVVLKFLGVPQLWLDIFSRFLGAPLSMGPIVRGTSDQILTRKCGVPVAHAFEAFFGEAVLFFLDLAIHQKTGNYLFRLRDRCFVVCKEQQLEDATREIEQFATAMHLKVGVCDLLASDPIGFVRLSASETPKGISCEIDNTKVEAYARRVKKQLATCSTVIEWISTWNNTIGTYASHLFGPLANVFGKEHLERVTQAYNRMYDIIFSRGNLTDHVKDLLKTHLGRPLNDPPFALEALLYIPLPYGGLGVKNPYVTLNLARRILEKPHAELEAYLDIEKKYYEQARETYFRTSPDKRKEKLDAIFLNDSTLVTAALGEHFDAEVFPDIEDIMANRERSAFPFLPLPPYPKPVTFSPVPSLIPLYNTLLEERIDHITASEKIHEEVGRLSSKLDTQRWSKLNGEDRWVLQMYGDECFERYGGLECWHGASVPRDALEMVRGKMLSDDDFDVITVSSTSTI